MVCYIGAQLEEPGSVPQLDLVLQDVNRSTHMMIPAIAKPLSCMLITVRLAASPS